MNHEGLNLNTKITTERDKTIIIEELLGEGGDSFIYKINYDGKPKILKWFKSNALGDTKSYFHNYIFKKILSGSPSNNILWPIDITELNNGPFGYVIDPVPEDYRPITEYLRNEINFNSFKTVIDASLKITSTFRKLHNIGYCFQNFYEDSIFIQPETGNVLFTNNEDIVIGGLQTNILPSPRYSAPEIVLDESPPTHLSDYHILSVILYLIFFRNHPLEGKRYLVDCFTNDSAKKLYGSEPIFIMDPNDDRNAPHPVMHKSSIQLWPMLPEYVKDIFIKAFSKTSFENPNSRPKDLDWMNVLIRFRNDIVNCDCENEVFLDIGKPAVCDECGKIINIPFKLELDDYSIPALKGSRIYRGHMGVCDAKDFLKPLGLVVANKNNPQELALRNLSDSNWIAQAPNGNIKIVRTNEIVPIKNGIELNILDKDLRIVETEN